MTLARSTLAVLSVSMLVACGPDRAELARLAPLDAAPRAPCGETTHGVSLADLDVDVEDWTIDGARSELGTPQLIDRQGPIIRAGWYDISLGQKNCGTLLTIRELGDQRIVTVEDLKPDQIWLVLDRRFPN